MGEEYGLPVVRGELERGASLREKITVLTEVFRTYVPRPVSVKAQRPRNGEPLQ